MTESKKGVTDKTRYAGSNSKTSDYSINRTKTDILNSDKHLTYISETLYKKFKKEELNRRYAPVKEVLTLLGRGALLLTLFMAPGAGKGLRPYMYGRKDWDEWKRYDPYYLKQAIKSLQKKKQIKFSEYKGRPVVKITKRGKVRILKYALNEIEIKMTKYWDRKWRIVVYDIPKRHTESRKDFQAVLKRLKFYQMQKSVYILPYPCKEEIDYIRHLLTIEEYVKIITAEKIEDEKAYREYFGV